MTYELNSLNLDRIKSYLNKVDSLINPQREGSSSPSSLGPREVHHHHHGWGWGLFGLFGPSVNVDNSSGGRDRDHTLQAVIFAGISIISSVGFGIGVWKSLSRDQALLKETNVFSKESIEGNRICRNLYFPNMINLTGSAKPILESKVREKSNYLNATILAGAGGLSLLVGVTATIPLLTISSAFLLIGAGAYAVGNLVWFWDAADVLKAKHETVSNSIKAIRYLIAENQVA